MKNTHRLPGFRFAIVAAGAIGLFYGAKLAARGRDVRFLLRSDYDAVRRSGIRIESKEGNLHLAKVMAHRQPEEIGTVDVILIGLKATANHILQETCKVLRGPDTWLVNMQNGIGTEESLARLFSTDRVVAAGCFVCLNRIAPGVVRHLGEGRITLADYAAYPRPFLHDLAWEFKRSGVACRVVASLGRARWEKLMWNIPFNGLCIAEGGVPVAELLAGSEQVTRVRALMEETRRAALAEGHDIPSDYADRLIDATRRMGDYRPSSLVDFELGRTLEIEAIWGEALRRGQANGVAMPQLAYLYHQLRVLQDKASAAQA